MRVRLVGALVALLLAIPARAADYECGEGENPCANQSWCDGAAIIFCEDFNDGNATGWAKDALYGGSSACGSTEFFSFPSIGADSSPALRYVTPGVCNVTTSTACNEDGDCPGGETCTGTTPNSNDGDEPYCGCGSHDFAPGVFDMLGQTRYYAWRVRFDDLGVTGSYGFNESGNAQKNFYPMIAHIGENPNNGFDWRVMVGFDAEGGTDLTQGELVIDATGATDAHSVDWRFGGCSDDIDPGDNVICGTRTAGTDVVFQENTWYHIEIRFTGASTTSSTNGAIEVWVDETLHFRYDNLNFIETTARPSRWWLNEFHGGNPCGEHKLQGVEWDDFVIATERIGDGNVGLSAVGGSSASSTFSGGGITGGTIH